MAKGVNKVTLLGNVGRAPEIKSTQGGTIVASFSLATPDRIKQNGNYVEVTEWHNVVCFGRTAEIVRDYVHKGSKLYLEGKLQTRSWDDKQTGKKMYRTEIVTFDIAMLDGKPQGTQQRSAPTDEMGTGQSYPYGDAHESITDEDIPF